MYIGETLIYSGGIHLDSLELTKIIIFSAPVPDEFSMAYCAWVSSWISNIFCSE